MLYMIFKLFSENQDLGQLKDYEKNQGYYSHETTTPFFDQSNGKMQFK